MKGRVNIAGVLAMLNATRVDPNKPMPWVKAPDRIDPAADQYARAAGPPAAAWMLWKYKRSLHTSGAVDFDFTPGDKLPPWFLVAVRCLTLRESHWDVVEIIKKDGKRAVRVRWKHWNRYCPTIPAPPLEATS